MFMTDEELSNTIFLDVETVSAKASYHNLCDRMKNLWNKKASNLSAKLELTINEYSQLYDDKAAIYAEFNRIICISVGILIRTKDRFYLKVKSFYGEDESVILNEFKSLLDVYYNDLDMHYLCGHNIREFDCPVICRRMLVNKIQLPILLDISRKKPWQLNHLADTLQMWKFGDFKSYVSLDLLAAILNIESPKGNIDGSMVSGVYWNDGDIERIKSYCEKDVVVTVKVFLSLLLKDHFDEVVYA